MHHSGGNVNSQKVVLWFVEISVFPESRPAKDACESHLSAVALSRFLTADMSGNPMEPPRADNRSSQEDFGHPRGTLAIVIVFGSLFLLGWLAMYVYMFLQRGAPHP
jgi:hypothetical protein